MKASNLRRFVIGTILFVVGATVYLSASDGPLRVRAVTVPVHLLFLACTCYAAWAPGITRRARFLVLIAIAALGSAAAVYVDSLVIMALYPLHPLYFIGGFLTFLIEAFSFLGMVWLIDRLFERVRGEGKRGDYQG